MFLSLKNAILAATLAFMVLSLLHPLVTLAAPLKKDSKFSDKLADKLKKGAKALKKGAKTLLDDVDSILTGSHITTLESFATLASIAYCVVDTWNCGEYCKDFPDTKVYGSIEPFFGSDQAVYVAYTPSVKSIIVAFRGTLSPQNFVTDLAFQQTDYPPVKGGKVHKGFYDDLNSVQSTIISTLHNATTDHPDVPIVFTGHSLGGAIAVLSALDMLQKGIITTSNAKVYTYGEPRIGNAAFANYVDGTGLPISRTTHYNDIIPHLPPVLLDYRHHSGEFWIHQDDNTTTQCVGQEDPSCADSTGLDNSLVSHLLYFRRINYCVYT